VGKNELLAFEAKFLARREAHETTQSNQLVAIEAFFIDGVQL